MKSKIIMVIILILTIIITIIIIIFLHLIIIIIITMIIFTLSLISEFTYGSWWTFHHRQVRTLNMRCLPYCSLTIWHMIWYNDRGLYCFQVEEWYHQWPKKQIKICSINDIKGDKNNLNVLIMYMYVMC